MDSSLNNKIIHSLERISKAFRVLLWEESKKHKLSPIQIQILLFCSTHRKEDLKVSFLAKEFDLTKATISDSIRVLIEKGLLLKETDIKDTRSYVVSLTKKGKEIVESSSNFSLQLDQSIELLSHSNKEILLGSLLHVIHELNQKEVISLQRMCLTCHHYSNSDNNHYCNLLEKKLKNDELRVDCPDHLVR
ncbi:MAG: winged helix DNA-binding protein [Flavobacteriales bacterium]|jgi:DNA-binding MarR family transcriptional regulator|nr:winged helix DNA-binding protein [Flavobacteriales bacterium]